MLPRAGVVGWWMGIGYWDDGEAADQSQRVSRLSPILARGTYEIGLAQANRGAFLYDSKVLRVIWAQPSERQDAIIAIAARSVYL